MCLSRDASAGARHASPHLSALTKPCGGDSCLCGATTPPFACGPSTLPYFGGHVSLFKLSPNGARVYGTDTSYVAEISERVLAWKKIPSIVKSAHADSISCYEVVAR